MATCILVESHLLSMLIVSMAHLQLEEDLADDLKWSMMVKAVLFSGKSKFQEVDLIHTGPFGKVRQLRYPTCELT